MVRDEGDSGVTDLQNLSFKVLGPEQRSHHGGTGAWRKGQWRSVKGELIPCENGIHYCGRDHLVRWLGPTIWVFEDGTPDETIDAGNKLVTRKGRVVERLETWNETTARLFAADCAEAVLHLIPAPRHEPFVSAIDAARKFAHGEIGSKELAAAEAATWAAIRAAAWDAARAATRAAT